MKQEMIYGNPAKSLIKFALPMILGNICQQLYGLIDTIVVGKFVGEDALAAVGTASAVTFLFIAIAMGASIGCGVVVSQMFGAKKFNVMKTAIYTSLISIVVIGLLLMTIGLLICGNIISWMQTPDSVHGMAESYLRIYFVGIVAVFVYNASNSMFNAIGKSKMPLMFLAFSSALNIILDLLFVINYGMGVEGVAWATLISQTIAAALCFITLLRFIRKIEGKSEKVFDASMLPKLYKIAVPTIIQQCVVSMGIVFMQSLVNSYGEVFMAGYTAACKIDGIVIIPMVQVGSALATYVAQNIGAGKFERIPAGVKTSLIIDAIFCVGIFLLVLFGGNAMLSLFLDPEISASAIGYGVSYLGVVSIFYYLMGINNVFVGVIRGAGDARNAMICMLLNFGIRIVMAYVLAYFFIAEAGVWWGLPLGWAAASIMAFILYKKGNWKSKAVV